MPETEFVHSVLRSLDILELVARSDRGATLQEIAAALDVAPPTAHNLARTLVARGYLHKTPRPVRYSLGPACFDLLVAQSRRALLHQVEVELPGLGRSFPAAAVIFAEAIGTEVVAVRRVGPERPGVVQQSVREPLAPYSAAASLAYQAFCAEGERQAYRQRHPFEELGAHHWGDLAALETFLDEVRRKGHVHLPVGTAAPTLRCAAPVFHAGGGLAGMVGLSVAPGSTATVKPATILRDLKAAAARLGRGAMSP
ncbi:MAG: helix-turn-helix domain-containing protein [Armatimonadetes bacterium]|nr:helix-turn-helix domain-containing protein [Armatimonadota bacterium]